ncbi:Rab-GTPase-TBC domain-containing protein [Cynara cardunculus var. scolymus]|uniref:Rab-GTPase-TBC domain-containing protein n=1 Tax=Cynara cardunculus var. scolymus TaxID=59895 RepID=A0A118JS17_CYNCS|nr:Rab-GTPase-TBC domain-containing protein [Cynara cardunculus var. scolymus]
MNILWKDPGLPTDSFYEVRAECTDVPKTKFKIKSGKTLSVRKWQSAFSPEGYLDIGQTLGRIYRGYYRLKELCTYMFPLVGSGKFITAPVITEDGVATQDPVVLLEANPENLMTPTNQATVASNSTTSCPKEEDKKIIQWKLTLHQIGLDVVRTDRTLVFYEKQENLAKLWDVLSVYAWFDKEVGYGQGMSDLCSPMIMLLEDEADAFWCFERLMRRLRGNFKCVGSSVGVESQLCNLANVAVIIYSPSGCSWCCFDEKFLLMMWALEYDPDLYTQYEESDSERPEDAKGKPKSSKQCGKFEREYLRSGAKVGEPLPISVFLVASVLKEKSVKLLTEAKGLDDVVKILNDTSGNLDARKACSGAMKLHKKYLKKVKMEKASAEKGSAAT